MKNIIIQKKILKIVEKSKKIPEKKFEKKLDYWFIDEGIVDSINLIRFILEIESKFKIKLTSKDTQSDNFRTINGITKIINKKNAKIKS
tara:strand:- start:14 stop:280 length:267 start_codon:yes stop_codon:yes gene_type:complete